MSRVPPTLSSNKAAEIAAEQRYVDGVHLRLAEMREDAAELLRRSYDEAAVGTFSAFFDRDAKVHASGLRARSLDAAHNELVFGRLDLRDGEVRYVGRLGIRTREMDPLVIDWRAPAAAAFYRATPECPGEVVRRRVLHCQGERVIDLEDDLLVPDAAPRGMTVVGDGAFLGALARARDGRMRDIVATIQREQDEVIRAPSDKTVMVRGGPGTGKTAVALHRVAWLMFNHRQRFGARGALVVGPNRRFTAYIERVLPALGEGGAALRSLGDLVDGVEAAVHDDPRVARVKGSARMARVLRRAVADVPPGAPETLRLSYGGTVVSLDRDEVEGVRAGVLRGRGRPNRLRGKAGEALAAKVWERYVALRTDAGERSPDEEERSEFRMSLADMSEFAGFLDAWWPVRTPRQVLSSLGDPARLRRAAGRLLSDDEIERLAAEWRDAEDRQYVTYQDAALLDELDVLLGRPPDPRPHLRDTDDSPYVVDGINVLTGEDVRGADDDEELSEVTSFADRVGRGRPPAGGQDEVEYAHIVVDEAQDLSPMQWRMLGRRGRHATWTVVADAAQSAWEDAEAAAAAMDAALGARARCRFELTTNYRNPVEIADVAARLLVRTQPHTRPPRPVRRTGDTPRFHTAPDDLPGAVRAVTTDLLARVDGTVGVITPSARAAEAETWVAGLSDRAAAMSALDAKGLEFDAVVLADPAGVAAESAAGARVLYVAVTRATHLLAVVAPDDTWQADLLDAPGEAFDSRRVAVR